MLKKAKHISIEIQKHEQGYTIKLKRIYDFFFITAEITKQKVAFTTLKELQEYITEKLQMVLE